MKRKAKSLISLLIALVLTISGAVMVFGASVTERDFEVIVTTDKSSYEAGEDVYMSVVVKNNATDATVTDVKLSYWINDDIKEHIVGYDKLPTSLSSLSAGDNKIFASKDIEDANNSGSNNPGDDTAGDNNAGDNNAEAPGTPGTGDNSNVRILVGALLVVAGIVVAVRMGCVKKFAALFMVVAMVAGLNATSLVKAKAEEKVLFLEGFEIITYAGEEARITVFVDVTLDFEPGDSEQAEINLTPTELAKLLLANERLDAESLKGDNKLITADAMAQTFNNLRVMTLSTTTGTEEFVKYSNMMSYFESYIDNVEQATLGAANTIDYVKESLNCTDVWLEYGGEEILLKVTDNAELLFIRGEDTAYICRRYTDSNGDEVYEVYKQNDTDKGNSYLLCIPDKRYEYSYHSAGATDAIEDDYDVYVVVENSRGYWNMFTTNPVFGEDRFNIQNLVAGSDFAYVYFGEIYDKDNGGYQSMDYTTFITPELDCDIVAARDISLGIKLVGFDGIEKIELDDDNFIISFTTANGTTINEHDMLINGVEYNYGAKAYSEAADAELEFRLYKDDELLAMNSEVAREIIDTLASYGITCKSQKDIDAVLDAIDSSYAIADNFDKYYNWNGYYLTDLEAAENAVAAGKERHNALMAELDAVKDAEKVETVSGGIDYDNYDFADIAVNDAEAVTFEDGKVVIDGLQVEVAVADVMMDGETYEIQYALAEVTGEEGNYGSVILIGTESNGAVAYNGSALEIQKSAEFDIPECTSAGVYTVVAYVATSEGIRVSKMVPVVFTDAEEYASVADGYMTEVALNDNNELVVRYTLANEYWVEYGDTDATISYDDVYEFLLTAACKYGYPDMTAVVEVYDVETGETREATENESLNGLVCRLAYDIPNMTAMTGYIYVELP